MAARGVAAGVSPLAQQRLDEALGLSVRARAIDAGVAALELGALRGLVPGARVVGLSVVGQDPLDGDALFAVPGERSFEEADAVVGVLAREELGVGQTRVIVD